MNRRKAGRKRKQGDRYPGGKLRPHFDKGSEWIEARREVYDEHYGSPIGRAFKKGFLGDGMEAKARLDAGKRFARLYSRFIEQGRYRCPLGAEMRSAGASVTIMAIPRGMEEQDWLFAAMDALDDKGLRPWLDQLLSEQFHDRGPIWLDRLLDGGRDPADQMVMKAALDALDVITPEVRHQGIRVVRA